MKGKLSKSDIEDLIVECGSTPTIWKRDDMQICCPVHQELHPSMGVSAEKQVCHCFACGFKGNFAWLLFNSQPDQYRTYRDALKYIEDTYEVSIELGENIHEIPRYEDLDFDKYVEDRFELPLYKIAPFKSGKETYKYFFDRGFTKDTMQKFMIGRDLVSKTVTIPVFYEDNKLAGVIGRYIDPKRLKNERYKIYFNFPRGNILYPIDKFEVIEDTAILVEGQLDAIRLHELGYTNALCTMGVELTKEQADILCEVCARVIDVGDNDERGKEARSRNKALLKGKVTYLEVDYPNHGKDVCDWSKEEIDEMIGSAHSMFKSIGKYV